MSIAARLDHSGRPAWIGLMVLGFIFWWPVGVAALAFLIWSGRMGCGHHEFGGRWQERMMERRARWEQRWAEHQSRHGHHGHHHRQSTSGNRAFDEYRADTLKRLEDEEREFREFLDQLRFAKDKVEFDQFLANRRPPAMPEPPVPN